MPIQTLYLNRTEFRDYIQWEQQPNGNVEIVDIVVNSERRKGYGRKMIDFLIQSKISNLRTPRCLLLFAVTRISNTVAHQFYEACGFRIVGRLHEFYSDDNPNGPTTKESALMYGKDL